MDEKEKKTNIPVNDFCRIQPTDVAYRRYDVYLNYSLDKPHYYFEFLEVLRSADEEDEICIHINNNGGYVDTAMQIINAMKESEATITTCLEGACHSVASMILLHGDIIKVSEFGSMLCHYYSEGLSGKGNEIEMYAQFSKKYYKKFFRKIYNKFLSKQEIDDLIKGKDLWLDSKQIIRRISKFSSTKLKPKDL